MLEATCQRVGGRATSGVYAARNGRRIGCRERRADSLTPVSSANLGLTGGECGHNARTSSPPVLLLYMAYLIRLLMMTIVLLAVTAAAYWVVTLLLQ
jgi:hypothetical protein